MFNVTFSKLDETDLEDLIANLAVFIATTMAHNEDVHFHFYKEIYISPALGIAVQAMRDYLSISGKKLYFSMADIEKNDQFYHFFIDSGLINTASPELQKKITQHEQRRQSQSKFEFKLAAHHIDLNDLRARSRSDAMHRMWIESSTAAATIKVDLLRADRDTLVSHLIELLDNAIEHSESEFAYTMCVNTKRGNTLMVVYDRGIGIPEAYERFRQEKGWSALTDVEAIQWAVKFGNSTKQMVRLMPRGAGLASLLDFAKQYHGRIAIASGSGGCTFDGNEKAWEMTVPLPGTMFIMTIPNK